MAQDPLRPTDDGRVKLPKVDAAHNKVAPADLADQSKKGEQDNPPPKREDEKDEDILARMRKRFDRCVQSESQNRKDGLDDLNFKSGKQWSDDVAAARQADKRPMLTINTMKTLVHQVTNDQRQNRPAINISPNGDKGDKEAAKLYRGWIRHLERQCAADIAYDTATDGAVSKGWGYWRILSEYESEDSFDQTLKVVRIRNDFTVYADPDAQDPTFAPDANFAFVTELMPRDEFEAKWPDASPMPWTQSGIGEDMKNWADQHNIRVAEYYERKLERRELVALDNGHVGWKDELDAAVAADLAAGRVQVKKTRQAEIAKVTIYTATGNEILDRKVWKGKRVPIVRVIGDEIDINGKVKYSGVIRDAKDPARMYNYWSTAETELIALAPKAPYIMEEGQVEGHEPQWKSANTKSFPYLLYRGVSLAGKPAPAPQRQPFGGSPQGVVQAKLGAANDIMRTTGIRFDASATQEADHRESGRLLREIRRATDLGNFHYVDNLSRALKTTGEIFLDLAPHYLDTPRMLTVLNEDDTEEQIRLDPAAPKAYQEVRGADGKTLKVFNPKLGQYSVTVTIGPSYATKRIEAGESMMAFAKAMPNTATLIADLIAKYQDWPGSDEMARRLAKAVPPNLLTPDQKDVPPQVQAVLQHLDAQVKQLSQERQQLMAALNERNADRAVAQDKVNKDFEAKLLGVLQKAEEATNKHVGQLVEQLMAAQQVALPAGVKAGAPDVPGPNAPAGGSSAGEPGAPGR